MVAVLQVAWGHVPAIDGTFAMSASYDWLGIAENDKSFYSAYNARLLRSRCRQADLGSDPQKTGSRRMYKGCMGLEPVRVMNQFRIYNWLRDQGFEP